MTLSRPATAIKKMNMKPTRIQIAIQAAAAVNMPYTVHKGKNEDRIYLFSANAARAAGYIRLYRKDGKFFSALAGLPQGGGKWLTACAEAEAAFVVYKKLMKANTLIHS